MNLQVTDAAEMAAVCEGLISGDTYQDGECWADAQSLLEWRISHPIAIPTIIEVQGESSCSML